MLRLNDPTGVYFRASQRKVRRVVAGERVFEALCTVRPSVQNSQCVLHHHLLLVLLHSS